ncbi:MAG: hypothetical protein HY963_08190 [Ignavibacteriales bacterium]|nr:hypothetical protein [Ignavibacteriales bacterium]
MKIFRSLIVFMVLLFVVSCDAPKLNPLDPDNPDSKLGQLNGFVKTQAIPQQSIPGVKVIWKNQNILAITAVNGSYKFEDLIMNDGWIYFEKEKYYKDSLYLQWNNVKIKSAPEKLLNYMYATLDGFVYDPLPDRQPISGVNVTWKNQNIVAQTDPNGSYKFNDLALNDGWLQFDKDGLFRDSLYVIWGNEKNKHMSDKTLGYKYVKIEGRVKNNVTKKEIAGVKVLWRNQNIIMETNSTGYYSFNNISQNSGWLTFDKEGYFKDSVFVLLSIQKSKLVDDKFLSVIPKLDNLVIYTIVENRYPEDQRYTLFVQASISDVENDIDSVNVRSTALNFNKQLKYNPQTRFYELSYPYGIKNSSPSIDDAIGKNFDIIIRNRSGRIFSVGSSTIQRIIKQEILFDSPANGITVGPKPVCRWNRFLPGFNFKYMIQIYTDETIPQLKWEKQNISKDDIEAIPEITLPAGDYYWVIWCIDDYQNRARSKPATFNVQ